MAENQITVAYQCLVDFADAAASVAGAVDAARTAFPAAPPERAALGPYAGTFAAAIEQIHAHVQALLSMTATAAAAARDGCAAAAERLSAQERAVADQLPPGSG